MPAVRVTLCKPTHDQLKIIAIGLDTTLAGVVIQACEEYARKLGVAERDLPKEGAALKSVPLAHSTKRNGKRS